jgi:hypothetical protein
VHYDLDPGETDYHLVSAPPESWDRAHCPLTKLNSQSVPLTLEGVGWVAVSVPLELLTAESLSRRFMIEVAYRGH